MVLIVWGKKLLLNWSWPRGCGGPFQSTEPGSEPSVVRVCGTCPESLEIFPALVLHHLVQMIYRDLVILCRELCSSGLRSVEV